MDLKILISTLSIEVVAIAFIVLLTMENTTTDLSGSLGVGDCNSQFNNIVQAIPRCLNVGGDGLDGTISMEQNIPGCDKSVGLGGNRVGETTDLTTYYGKPNPDKIDEQSDYYKDVEAIMNEATVMIKKMDGALACLKKNGVKPAVMFDQDDTIWSTWYETNNTPTPFKYDYDTFNKIASQKKMPPIKPVVDFIKFLVQQDITPIFVTGRKASQNMADITLTQLKGLGLQAGVDYWAGSPGKTYGNGKEVKSINGIFMHDKGDTRTGVGSTASLYKQTARCFIESNGLDGQKFKFIASCGDQWSDSNGECAGLRIKLPNPMYYLP